MRLRKKNKPPKQQSPLALLRKGWFLSLLITIVLLAWPFKPFILTMLHVPHLMDKLAASSPVWQSLIKGSVSKTVGSISSGMRPLIAIVGGTVLVIYVAMSGHRRILRELELNRAYGTGHSTSEISNRVIIARSLFINIPLIFWGIYLFWILPNLTKMPLAAISTGKMSSLVGSCVIMVIIAFLLTHIGMQLARLAIQFIERA